MSNATTPDKSENKELTTETGTLKGMLSKPNVKGRFEEILGKKAPAFISSIISVTQGSKQLVDCDPASVISAAAIAASLDLPINPNLGYAAIVPYREGGKPVAQFQIMWKGFVQLAHRTGLYKSINLARVYEGELVSYDRFSGKVNLDASKKVSDKVMGYFFRFELNNGFVHEEYWSALRCVKHGLKFSKSFQNGKGKWTEDVELGKAGGVQKWVEGETHLLTEGSGTDAMSAKTIVKGSLSKWAPLSTDHQRAVEADQAVISEDGKPSYIDATTVKDGEGEVTETPAISGPVSTEAQEVELAGGTYAVTKAGEAGARVVARDSKVYVTANEDLAKFLLKAMASEKGLRLTVWQGTTESEIESAETVKA